MKLSWGKAVELAKQVREDYFDDYTDLANYEGLGGPPHLEMLADWCRRDDERIVAEFCGRVGFYLSGGPGESSPYSAEEHWEFNSRMLTYAVAREMRLYLVEKALELGGLDEARQTEVRRWVRQIDWMLFLETGNLADLYCLIEGTRVLDDYEERLPIKHLVLRLAGGEPSDLTIREMEGYSAPQMS